MEFNEAQTLAISHKDGPMLVLAGPGSGKTAVITQRIINLITRQDVEPSSILVITFTKAAAQEMKQRFYGATNREYAVNFGTFHSVFFMILRLAYHYDAGNIISEEQKHDMMHQLLSGYTVEYRDEGEFITSILGEFSRIKNDNLSPEEYEPSCCKKQEFMHLYEQYSKRLRSERRLDFDDMMLYTYELFRERRDILQVWQQKYRYILVDEFQDINKMQFTILRMLSAPLNNLFVVGDDDQSIYRFRGSNPQLMLDFTQYYPQASQVLLNRNYRSKASIVAAAKALIDHNKVRFPKEIIANDSAMTCQSDGANPDDCDEGVRILTYENRKLQQEGIQEQIEALHKKGVAYKEMAVLFRTNTGPRMLTELLSLRNIPFRMKDLMPNLYEHWVAQDVFTYLEIAGGNTSRNVFLRIMNKPNRFLRRERLYGKEIDFTEWMKRYQEEPWMKERIEKLQMDVRLLARMSPYAAINYVRHGIGYEDYLQEYAKSHRIPPEDLFGVLDELQETAKGYGNYTAWKVHITEYCQEMKEIAQRKNQRIDALTLATLHSSKGLEFDYVFLLDVNEGSIPYKKAVLPEQLEEERRLFYVGMTRARKCVYMGCVNSSQENGMEPSRFLKELDLNSNWQEEEQ